MRWSQPILGRSLVAVLCLCCTSAIAARPAAKGAARPAAKDAPQPERVAEWTAMLPKQPTGVGRPIADRAAWKLVAAGAGAESTIRHAAQLLREPIPQLTDDVYLDFSRTGNRKRGERVLFDRRNRLSTLVLAECLENHGRFLAAIEVALRENAKDKAWVLPAHDRSLKIFRGEIMDIDLVSSATSWEFATADYWLGDKLSPEVRKLIRAELERRTFAPFESMMKTGSPRIGWVHTTNNWNAVCLANVAGAALAVIDSPQRRALFAASAEKHIQNFLNGFTPDGYCSEGMGYWNYGFGHFVLLAETLSQASGGKVDLLDNPKVQSIAQFGRRLEIFAGIYLAFADCHLGARPDGQIQGFVSRRYGFGWTAEEQRGLASGVRGSLSATGIYGFPNSATRRAAAKAAAALGLRDWFSDAGILICRPAPGTAGPLGVALKGGHNAEHHNHNDVGSFVVAVGKSTPLLDPGAEVYTARTFSGQRYESKVLNSFGHPVPRVAGRLQQPGRSAEAKVLKAEFTDHQDLLVLDIRSAYPVQELTRLQRTFLFQREGRGRLTITDEVEFASPQAFGTALMTFSKWRTSGEHGLVVGAGADAVQVAVSAEGAAFRIEPTEIHEEVPGKLVPIRLGIELTQPVRKALIRTVIEPAKETPASPGK